MSLIMTKIGRYAQYTIERLLPSLQDGCYVEPAPEVQAAALQMLRWASKEGGLRVQPREGRVVVFFTRRVHTCAPGELTRGRRGPRRPTFPKRYFGWADTTLDLKDIVVARDR